MNHDISEIVSTQPQTHNGRPEALDLALLEAIAGGAATVNTL